MTLPRFILCCILSCLLSPLVAQSSNPTIDSTAETKLSPMDSLATSPSTKKDIAPVDSSLLFVDEFLNDMKFRSDDYEIVVGYDLSRLIWEALDNSISGYKFRLGLNREPWGIQAEYGFEQNKTSTIHYTLDEKGNFYNIGIHYQTNWNSFGVGYQIVNYERRNAKYRYYDVNWEKDFVDDIRDYDFQIKSFRLYDHIRANLFGGLYLYLGGSIDFIQNYAKDQNVPMFWIPGMTLEWSKNFNARLNFEYTLSYHFKF